MNFRFLSERYNDCRKDLNVHLNGGWNWCGAVKREQERSRQVAPSPHDEAPRNHDPAGAWFDRVGDRERMIEDKRGEVPLGAMDTYPVHRHVAAK